MVDGLSSRDAADAAGMTFRQLDYWTRPGAITPSIAEAAGVGSRRLWSHDDIVVLRALVRVARDFAELGIDGMPVELVARLWTLLKQQGHAVITERTVSISVGRSDNRPCDHRRARLVYGASGAETCERCGEPVT